MGYNVNEWVEITKETIAEDLAVWFGKKKKPKGSKQPKGPWVNICSKDKNGKHPPCGRSDSSKGAYPKCRAAGVAGKMTDAQKKAACQQKRRAEKKDTQRGKGQKPVMTSYKPKNESKKLTIKLTESNLKKIVTKLLSEQSKMYDYMLVRTDNFNEPTKASKLYFVKRGNTYEVYSKLETSKKINSENFILPLESELGVKYDGSKFLNNEMSILGNKLAKMISSNYKMSSGNWVIYVNNDGIPAIGRLVRTKFPINFFEKNNKIKKDLKQGQIFTTQDYFVDKKEPNFGHSFGIKEITLSETSDI